MLSELLYIAKKRDTRSLRFLVKSCLPTPWVSNTVFKKNYGRNINFSCPTLFDEKLMVIYSKDYCKNLLVKDCVDKYKVRDYISEWGYSETLNPLLDVYSKASDIDINSYPSRFVIKTNHGCGMNIIVWDKSKINLSAETKKLDEWMKIDYGRISGELQYIGIQRHIMIEKFIETPGDELPVDFKFFCSRGKVICCLVITGRGRNKLRVFVDKNYDWLEIEKGVVVRDYKQTRPDSYDNMWKMAGKLSQQFPFVRVDLYDVRGKIIFGELTFTPHGMVHNYMTLEAQKWLGDQIQM
ncbi:MAG: hypothetical protein LUC94_01755 [Clostridiales bacterium]|nr:hypothetical protein [Clostridiales bacterium]